MTDLYYAPYDELLRARNLKTTEEIRAELFATLSRINTLYMITRAGSGHIGSSFSCTDIVSWLYLNELRPDGIFYSSKGHDAPAVYSVMIGMGLLKFDLIHALRREGGLPGHPDVSTPFIQTNTGSLGMGISKAKGMIQANRLLKKTQPIYVLTGDGELQEGQFWESLPSAANLGLGEITAIVDHNKIQSDTYVAAVSDLGELEKKFRSFGWHAVRTDGHDFGALRRVFSELKKITDKPKVVIADTMKGKGVSFMEPAAMRPEDKLYRFHSGAPDENAYAKGLAELSESANRLFRKIGAPELKLSSSPRPQKASIEGFQRLIPAYSKELVKQAARNPKIVVLDADLMLDCGLIPFKERFPERFFECGIAEQDMVSQAGGMALEGLLPVVHSFACFLSTRPNEQIYNNATEKTKILYVGSLAGLLPGGPGHSHQSVRDISALAAVPGLILVEPSSEEELPLVLDFCLNGTSESCYLRLVSVPCDVRYKLPKGYRPELGKGVALTEGRDAVIFGYGPVLLPQACQAAKILSEKHGIGLKVVNLPWLNRLDAGWLKETVKDCPMVFTLDNHYVAGGQGEMISSRLAELGLSGSCRLKPFGVRTIPVCGQNDEVLRAHRLDADSLAQDIQSAVGELKI